MVHSGARIAACGLVVVVGSVATVAVEVLDTAGGGLGPPGPGSQPSVGGGVTVADVRAARALVAHGSGV